MSDQPFGDIPLFREIQKILASSEGPINYEIARQVATAAATQGVAEAAADPAVARAWADGVHEAEVLVAGYTRLPLVEPTRTQVVDRVWWVRSTMQAWAWLLERLAGRFTAELGRVGGEGAEESNAMEAAMGQVAPLLTGLQAGTLLGQLGREAIGRHDFPIPRDDDAALFLLTANADNVASDYGFEIDVFRRWLALQDVTRHLVMIGTPWVNSYARSLLSEVVDSTEIDVADLERRLMELQTKGMEALDEGLAAAPGLPVVASERHERALHRLHAFLALVEGYARSASRAVGLELLGETHQIDEGMARRRMSTSQGDAMLGSVLGVSLDRALEAAGETFCAAILKLHGLAALNQVWHAPDNLPTLEEIKDPFLWIERVLGE